MPAPVRIENAATTALVSGVVTRTTAPRSVRVVRVVHAPVIADPASTRLGFSVAALVMAPASVPLFKAHCSFLI